MHTHTHTRARLLIIYTYIYMFISNIDVSSFRRVSHFIPWENNVNLKSDNRRCVPVLERERQVHLQV